MIVVDLLLSGLCLDLMILRVFSYRNDSMIWNIPLVSLGQLSQLCPLPASCSLPAHLLWQGVGKRWVAEIPVTL